MTRCPPSPLVLERFPRGRAKRARRRFEIGIDERRNDLRVRVRVGLRRRGRFIRNRNRDRRGSGPGSGSAMPFGRKRNTAITITRTATRTANDWVGGDVRVNLISSRVQCAAAASLVRRSCGNHCSRGTSRDGRTPGRVKPANGN